LRGKKEGILRPENPFFFPRKSSGGIPPTARSSRFSLSPCLGRPAPAGHHRLRSDLLAVRDPEFRDRAEPIPALRRSGTTDISNRHRECFPLFLSAEVKFSRLFFAFAIFLAFLIPPTSANMAVIFSVSICLEFKPSYFASFFSFT